MKRRGKSSRRKPLLSFIGAGSVGTAFATALQSRGYRIQSVISLKSDSAKRMARRVKAPSASIRLEDLARESEVIFITTPDQSIAPTASALSRMDQFNFSKMIFVHTSGALGSELLSPLAKKGAHVLSLHPIQLFPRKAKPRDLARRLSGIYFGVEGDAVGLAAGKKLVRDIGGRALLIREELKPLYHVACVVASNYLVALMSLLEEVYSKLSVQDGKFMNVFEKLIGSTIDSVRTTSPRDALTGPIERGDVNTIRLHLKELNRALPYLVPFYTVMGMETIRLAVKKGSLTTKQAAVLLDAMSNYIRREAPSELLAHYQDHKN